MWNARSDESQAGIKIAGRNNNNLRYADDITLMAEIEEELKSLWMRVKEESEKKEKKNWLKTQQSKKLRLWHLVPITSWQIEGENIKEVTDFIFLGSKIPGDGDCSHNIKRCLFLGRKSMTNLDSVLRSRDITLPTKVDIVRALIFPVMYRYEKSEVAQSCLTLCDPLVCSLPGSPLHGIFQARILEWVAISYSRESSRLRDWTHVSCVSYIGRQILYHCAT